MQQRSASTQKPDNCKSRQRSSLLSWIFNRHENNNDSSSSATIDEASYKTETNNSYINANLTEREYYMRTSHSVLTTAPMHGGSNKHPSIDPCRNVQERQTISGTEVVTTSSIACNPDNNISEPVIQIPNRRQSHLYTPFHNQFQDTNINNKGTENVISDASTKRRSYYVSHLSPIPDPSNSTSSLSRSASWQPSSSSAPSSALLSPHQLQNSAVDNIPARRTSRNYSKDPEIQAKLDAILSSEKTYLLSHVLHNNNNNNETLNKNNTNVYRRSTTPANRPL